MKKIMRGISEEFAQRIKQDKYLQQIYDCGKEMIWGIRNSYVNLYYNSDSIALIRQGSPKTGLLCEINKYYIDQNTDSKTVFVQPSEILDKLEQIKLKSQQRATEEKKAQQMLYLLNNKNEKSNWFCIDIEYAKSYYSIEQRKQAQFSPRFDIIAISKTKPFDIAIIELKYGKSTFGGSSGIRKHIDDFYKMKNCDNFNDSFKCEIVEIIKGLDRLGVDVPKNLTAITANDFCQIPKFFLITLDDNAYQNQATPHQSCAGYLFNQRRWGAKRVSKQNVQSIYGDITVPNDRLFVKFLFSKQTLDNLTINDIIDGEYDRWN